MQTRMNCIIIDDEPLAQKGLEGFVQEMPFLDLIATCDNALEAIDLMATTPPDLIFLDIKMPKMTGVDLLKSMNRPPLTIITTAYPDFALLSYELSVLDYLVKPIPFDRFVKAVNRARDYHELITRNGNSKPANDQFCFIRCDNRYEKILFDEILYIEALQNYVMIYTKNKKLISYLTIKSIEEHLPGDQFIKVNKSSIIPLARIDTITGNVIQVGAHTVTIGRPYREQAFAKTLGDKLIRRNR